MIWFPRGNGEEVMPTPNPAEFGQMVDTAVNSTEIVPRLGDVTITNRAAPTVKLNPSSLEGKYLATSRSKRGGWCVVSGSASWRAKSSSAVVLKICTDQDDAHVFSLRCPLSSSIHRGTERSWRHLIMGCSRPSMRLPNPIAIPLQEQAW